MNYESLILYFGYIGSLNWPDLTKSQKLSGHGKEFQVEEV